MFNEVIYSECGRDTYMKIEEMGVNYISACKTAPNLLDDVLAEREFYTKDRTDKTKLPYIGDYMARAVVEHRGEYFYLCNIEKIAEKTLYCEFKRLDKKKYRHIDYMD